MTKKEYMGERKKNKIERNETKNVFIGERRFL